LDRPTRLIGTLAGPTGDHAPTTPPAAAPVTPEHQEATRVDRANQFVIVAAWKSAKAFEAHATAGPATGFRA
jgi:hypothetical protein